MSNTKVTKDNVLKLVHNSDEADTKQKEQTKARILEALEAVKKAVLSDECDSVFIAQAHSETSDSQLMWVGEVDMQNWYVHLEKAKFFLMHQLIGESDNASRTDN